MTIQDLTNRVAHRVGIQPEIAERAVGTILSILLLEGQGSKVDELFAKLPGASELAQQYSVAHVSPVAEIAGMATVIVTPVLGNKAGTLLKGLEQLQSLGLTTDQIKHAGREVFAFATVNSDRTLVREVMGSIPGLRTKLAA